MCSWFHSRVSHAIVFEVDRLSVGRVFIQRCTSPQAQYDDKKKSLSALRILYYFGLLKSYSRVQHNSCVQFIPCFFPFIQLLRCAVPSADLNAVHAIVRFACRMRQRRRATDARRRRISRHTIRKGIIFVCTKRSRARVASFFCCRRSSKLEIQQERRKREPVARCTGTKKKQNYVQIKTRFANTMMVFNNNNNNDEQNRENEVEKKKQRNKTATKAKRARVK